MSIKAFLAAAGLAVAAAAIVPGPVSAQGMHHDDHRDARGPMVGRHDARRNVRHHMRRRPICRVTWVHHRKVRRCR